MTPEQFALYVIASGVVGAVGFTLLSIYLTVSGFTGRAVWKDSATRRDKVETTVRYTLRNKNWMDLPKIASRGAISTVSGTVLGLLLFAGFESVFL